MDNCIFGVSELQNPGTDKIFDVFDYVCDMTSHAKIENDFPIWGVPVHAWVKYHSSVL